MEEVACDAAVDGVVPCQLGTECRQHREIESRKNAAISIQPLWRRRLGRNFIRGNDDDDALLVVQVKTAVWERSTTRKRAIDGIDTNGAPDKRCAISIY